MPYTSAAFAPCGVRTWCVPGAMALGQTRWGSPRPKPT
jgi:hypothetical protein